MRLFLTLIFTLYANASFALSIGEATLKSYLGEPLIVKLNVTDVEKSPDSNCFTITDTNDTSAFRKAFVTLARQKDSYQLTITTQSIITEPILSLRVSYHCEPQLERDYVLLLDPVTNESEASDNANPNTQKTNDEKEANRNSAQSNGTSQQTLATSNSATTPLNKAKNTSKRKSTKRAPSAKSIKSDSASIDERMMESYTGKPSSPSKEVPASSEARGNNEIKNRNKAELSKPSETSKPYLSISGGSVASETLSGQTTLNLKFETLIDLNRAPPVAAAESTELMDEVTVMSNRLTHLEKQIITLQTQNAQLRSEADTAKNALSQQTSSWIDYLLFAVGGALLLSAALWIKNSWATRRAFKQALNWQDNDDAESSEFESTFSRKITPTAQENQPASNVSFAETFLDDQSFEDEKIEEPKSSMLSTSEHVSDEHDSIIDNADVFIEHERPLLAIQLLQNHLNDFPTESPKIWIKLLALLATEGTEAEYNAAANEAKKHFNINFPSYIDAKNEDTSSLEDFADIVARLEGVWGSPFAVKFLNDLIYDQHAQPAKGFTPNNFEELFFLKKIAALLNTGVSTNQRTLYRSAPPTNRDNSTKNTASNSPLDNLAFNEATFGDDLDFGQSAFTATTTQAESPVMSDDDFTVASFPDGPELKSSDKPSKEDVYAQFENSPFQKVPSYDVDMLVDFDDHIETTPDAIETPLFHETEAEEITNVPSLEKGEPTQDADETLHFPLNVYPEENLIEQDIVEESLIEDEDQPSSQEDKKPTSTKSKDSNLIEWDLPKLD